jgi:hypothetical protein
MQPATPEGMVMLPNDHHPGPRCSCRECLRKYPDAIKQRETDFESFVEDIRKAKRLA